MRAINHRKLGTLMNLKAFPDKKFNWSKMENYKESEMIACKRIEGQGTGYIAKEDISKGVKLMEFDGEVKTEPDAMSLQIGKNKYLGGPGAVNHSCNPNCHIEFDPPRLISSQYIEKGDQITFNYLTTEWELAEPFKCRCNSNNCFEKIKGFKYLENEDREKIDHIALFLWELTEENE